MVMAGCFFRGGGWIFVGEYPVANGNWELTQLLTKAFSAGEYCVAFGGLVGKELVASEILGTRTYCS